MIAENVFLIISVTIFGVFCTLGNFSKPSATIDLPKSLTFLRSFCKGVIFLVKSFLANFYRRLAIFSGHTANNRACLGS